MASSVSEDHPQRLARLDQRHDELLGKLDELNEQIEAALATLAAPGETTSAPDARSC